MSKRGRRKEETRPKSTRQGRRSLHQEHIGVAQERPTKIGKKASRVSKATQWSNEEIKEKKRSVPCTLHGITPRCGHKNAIPWSLHGVTPRCSIREEHRTLTPWTLHGVIQIIRPLEKRWGTIPWSLHGVLHGTEAEENTVDHTVQGPRYQSQRTGETKVFQSDSASKCFIEVVEDEVSFL